MSLLKKFLSTRIGYELGLIFLGFSFVLNTLGNKKMKGGEFFGYPDCCNFDKIGPIFDRTEEINFIGKNFPHWLHSGFIPCRKCAEKYRGKEKELEKIINSKRISPIPFPGKTPIYDFFQFSFDMFVTFPIYIFSKKRRELLNCLRQKFNLDKKP